MALAHAILASVLGGPSTGYDLAKTFGSDGFFWRASHQQIYLELKKLESAGLIELATESAGPRKDRPFAITGDGRSHLAEWIREPTDPASIKEDILVKCLAADLVPTHELIEQIVLGREQHLARLSHYADLRDRNFPEDRALVDEHLGRYLALIAGISYERHWIDWADTAIRLLASTASHGS